MFRAPSGSRMLQLSPACRVTIMRCISTTSLQLVPSSQRVVHGFRPREPAVDTCRHAVSRPRRILSVADDRIQRAGLYRRHGRSHGPRLPASIGRPASWIFRRKSVNQNGNRVLRGKARAKVLRLAPETIAAAPAASSQMLAGQVALVTGASRGIGRATADFWPRTAPMCGLIITRASRPRRR